MATDIEIFLGERAPDLLRRIDELFAIGSPFSGRTVTFIYPSAAHVEEILGDDDDRAAKILRAHMFPDVAIKTTDGFRTQPANALGFRPRVEQIQGNTVIFEGECYVSPDRDFSNGEQHALYRVTRGNMPLDGDSTEPVSGAFEPRRDTRRGEFARYLEEQYRIYLVKRSIFTYEDGTTKPYCNPYMEFLVAFHEFLKAKYPAYLDLDVIWDYDPIATFYILFEPYLCNTDGRQVAEHIIPDGIVRDFHPFRVYGNVFEKYYAILDAVSVGAELKADIAKLRGRQRNIKFAGEEVRRECYNYYKDLFSNRVLPSYPKDTLKLIGSPERKLWQDVFRTRFCFFYKDAFPPVTKEGSLAAQFNDMAQIDHCVSRFVSNIRRACVCDCPFPQMPGLKVKGLVEHIETFFKSCCFLYHVTPVSEVLNSPDTHSADKRKYEMLKFTSGKFDRTKALQHDISVRARLGVSPPPFTLTGGSDIV